MSTLPQPLPAADRGSRLVLGLVLALPILLALSPRDLWAPEEPRFGRVAHEMATENDWLVTRLDGLVDAEKPPLLFWMMAGIERVVGGPSPVGARLPAALLAVLGVLATRSLVRRWWNDRALADTAAVLFATTAVVVWNSPRVGMDVGLAAFSAIALEGASAAIVAGSWAGALRMGLALGLGLLLKGPHVLYVPLAGALGGAIASRRAVDSGARTPRGASIRVVVGILLGAAIFAAWLVPALAFRGDEPTALSVTYRQRLLGQIASRVSGADEPHVHGPFYLLPIFVASLLPWLLFAAAGARSAVRARTAPPPDRFGLGAALAGLLLPLLLLSIPASKRETYVVPLLPCAAALAAYAVHRAPLPSWNRAGARTLVGFLAVVAIGLFAAPQVGRLVYTADHYDVVTGETLRVYPARHALHAFGILAAAAAVWVAVSRGSIVVAARRTAVAIAALAIVCWFAVLPVFDPAKSFVDAVAIARREAPNASFYVAGTSDPSSLWNFGYDRVGFIADHAALARVRTNGPARVLVLAKGRFWTDRASLAKPEDLPALDMLRVLWERRVNGSTWHLLTDQ